jgi:hypothetical protein
MRSSMLSKRAMALALSAAVAGAPFAGCTNSDHRQEVPPPVDDTRGGQVEPTRKPVDDDRPRISTKTKLVVLAGAAALYYLYKKHKSAQQQEGVDGQYYLSKNGRVYYRDAEHRAHWVTPPPNGITVPEAEAAEFRDFQGYNHQPTGRDLTSLAPDQP